MWKIYNKTNRQYNKIHSFIYSLYGNDHNVRVIDSGMDCVCADL